METRSTRSATRREAATSAGPLAQTPLAGSLVRSRHLLPLSRVPLIRRPRLEAMLAAAADVPLTIVKADAGYGKTTAVASLAQRHFGRVAWYGLTSDDADLYLFLRHLFAAVEALEPGSAARALSKLEVEGGAAKRWAAAVDALSNDLYDRPSTPLFVILDNWHLVDEPEPNAALDRLLSYAPPNVHVVMTSRQAPGLPHLARRRIRGEVLELTRADLAFDVTETLVLFGQGTRRRPTGLRGWRRLQRPTADHTGSWPSISAAGVPATSPRPATTWASTPKT